MERAVRDFLEAGFNTYRGNAAWLREAFSDGRRSDLRGEVTAVAGARLTDKRKAYPWNIYGRREAKGVTHPGATLAIVSGEAAGETYEIDTTSGQHLTVVGAVDLVTAGVAPGDTYEIRPAFFAQAVEWAAKTDVSFLLGWPATHQDIPGVAVIGQGSGESSTFIGRLDGTGGPTDGPIGVTKSSLWRDDVRIMPLARSPDEVVYLCAILQHLFRQGSGFFDRIFKSPPTLNVGDIAKVALIENLPTFGRELRLGGERQVTWTEAVDWFVDERVAVEVDPRTVKVRVPG